MAETKKPVVISVLNLKGGVGKTTIATLLARHASGTGEFRMRGQNALNVLAVDLDPQANLSQALMGEQQYKKFMTGGEKSVVELFKAPSRMNREDIVKKTPSGLEFIPSRFDFADNLISSLKADERVLGDFIGREMSDKNLILIDCAPTESVLSQAAYYASDYVLVPVRPEFFATIGFPLMWESLDNFYGKYPERKTPERKIKVFALINYATGTENKPSLNRQRRTAVMDICSHASKFEWPILYYPMWPSAGFHNWMDELNAGRLGNTPDMWRPIADEILQLIGLSSEMPESGYVEGAKKVHGVAKYVEKKIEREKEKITKKYEYMDRWQEIARSEFSEEMKVQKITDLKKELEEKIANNSIVKCWNDFPESVKKVAEDPAQQWEKRIQIDKLIVELMEAIQL